MPDPVFPTQDELAAVIAEVLPGPDHQKRRMVSEGVADVIAAAVRSFMGSPEVVERVSSAIASNVRLEWHGHDHAGINSRSVVVAARAALSAAIGEDIGGGRG